MVTALGARHWNCVPQNSEVKVLTTTVMVFRDRVSRRKVRLDEVVRVGPDQMGWPCKKTTGELSLSRPHPVL